MKSVISLFVEIKRAPGTYEAFHYVGEENPSNWLRLPLNFSEAVKVCEINKLRLVKNLTFEELVINDFEKLVSVFFASNYGFRKTVIHSITSD